EPRERVAIPAVELLRLGREDLVDDLERLVVGPLQHRRHQVVVDDGAVRTGLGGLEHLPRLGLLLPLGLVAEGQRLVQLAHHQLEVLGLVRLDQIGQQRGIAAEGERVLLRLLLRLLGRRLALLLGGLGALRLLRARRQRQQECAGRKDECQTRRPANESCHRRSSWTKAFTVTYGGACSRATRPEPLYLFGRPAPRFRRTPPSRRWRRASPSAGPAAEPGL